MRTGILLDFEGAEFFSVQGAFYSSFTQRVVWQNIY